MKLVLDTNYMVIMGQFIDTNDSFGAKSRSSSSRASVFQNDCERINKIVSRDDNHNYSSVMILLAIVE